MKEGSEKIGNGRGFCMGVLNRIMRETNNLVLTLFNNLRFFGSLRKANTILNRHTHINAKLFAKTLSSGVYKDRLFP